MQSEEYDKVIGKLVRLKVWTTAKYHGTIDELIEALVDEAEGL